MIRDGLLPILAFAAFCAVSALLGWAMFAISAVLQTAGWSPAGAQAAVFIGAVLLVVLVGARVVLLIIDRMEA